LAEGEKKKKGIIYEIKLREGEKLYAKEVREKKERAMRKRQNPPFSRMLHPALSPRKASYGRRSVMGL
jgi:hypothetical protein